MCILRAFHVEHHAVGLVVRIRRERGQVARTDRLMPMIVKEPTKNIRRKQLFTEVMGRCL